MRIRLRCIFTAIILTILGLLVVYSEYFSAPDFSTHLKLISFSTLVPTELIRFSSNKQSYDSHNSTEVSTTKITTTFATPTKPAKTIHDIISKRRLKIRGRLGAGRGVVIWTRDIYEPGFQYRNSRVCPNSGNNTKLVIVIYSAPSHFSARGAIRLTWGHFTQRRDVAMAFVIGKTENDTVLEGLENEKQLYDDLILTNSVDSYDNLTLKTMATLEWIDTYCNKSKYILKTDDDMFIHVPNLLKFIRRIKTDDKRRPKFYGRLARKWKPVRNKQSKYYVSFQQYKKPVYPNFNTGPAYLFTTRLVRPLFEKGMEKTYLKLEDVYTTGILADELAIKRMNIADFANRKVNFHRMDFCELSKLISMHMVAYHEQFELWKKILNGRTKCESTEAGMKKDKQIFRIRGIKQSDNLPLNCSSVNKSDLNKISDNVTAKSTSQSLDIISLGMYTGSITASQEQMLMNGISRDADMETYKLLG